MCDLNTAMVNYSIRSLPAIPKLPQTVCPGAYNLST
jgi:hypothetical protein